MFYVGLLYVTQLFSCIHLRHTRSCLSLWGTEPMRDHLKQHYLFSSVLLFGSSSKSNGYKIGCLDVQEKAHILDLGPVKCHPQLRCALRCTLIKKNCTKCVIPDNERLPTSRILPVPSSPLQPPPLLCLLRQLAGGRRSSLRPLDKYLG